MSELISAEIQKKIADFKSIKNVTLSKEKAFSYILLEYVFGVEFIDQNDLVTDGPNDGGIDFVYYEEEEAKVIICQAKYTNQLSFNEIIAELDKMYSTLQNFKNGNTGMYNDRLKKAFQNALDRLPEEGGDNVEFNLFTVAPFDVNDAIRKINNTQHGFPADAVKIFIKDDIEKEIKNVLEALDFVEEEKIKLDKPKNFLAYESEKNTGIMCNVLSTSIVKLYNKYAGKGLFDLNIRKYIRNKLVDDGIKATLEKDRENFWFLNNGIIIACKEFEVDGDTVKLWDFSIVNGGQTTTLISTYRANDTKEFYVPCKIVSTKDTSPVMSFFTKIAEATNSQKPIYARDLKSNTPEMVRLARSLRNEKIYLEIKRGVKPDRKYKYSIKNDELAQIILSFAFQRPGTSRSGKKGIFESSDLYASLFKVNYFDEAGKKGFLLDIIDLYDRFKVVEKAFKSNGELSEVEMDVLKNGRQVIFAVMGILYRLENGDVTENDLKNYSKTLKSDSFTYAKFISNYKKDDLETKLKRMIKDIITIVGETYQIAYDNKKTTSMSNYMKTDSKYYEDIVVPFGKNLQYAVGRDLKETMGIFKR